MEKEEIKKRQIMIYGILLLGSFSFVSMLYSLNDNRFFNISLAILILTLTGFMIDVLYFLSKNLK